MNSDNSLPELSVILFLQAMHLLHGPTNGPRVTCCPPLWFVVIQLLRNINSSVQLQKGSCCQNTLFPSFVAHCILTLSLYEAQRVEHKLLSLQWIQCSLGTTFLTRLSPPTTGRGSRTLSPFTRWPSPSPSSPLDTSRTSLVNLHQNCLWWNTYSFEDICPWIVKFNVPMCVF